MDEVSLLKKKSNNYEGEIEQLKEQLEECKKFMKLKVAEWDE